MGFYADHPCIQFRPLYWTNSSIITRQTALCFPEHFPGQTSRLCPTLGQKLSTVPELAVH